MMVEEKFDEHVDTKAAIRAFIQHFETEYKVSLVRGKLESNITLVGGNFTTRILRLNFQYPGNGDTINDSVLLKIPSLCRNYENILKSCIYDNEIYVYQHLLPAIHKIWPGERLTPVFHVCTEAKVLILEDLTRSGFRPREKKERLDLAHSRAAVTMLARFHAATVKYLQQLEARQESLPQSLIEPIKPATFKEQAGHFHKQFLEMATGKVSQSVLQKVLDFEDKLLSASPYHINSDRNNLTVIVHGDFWTGNILFQQNDRGEVTGTRMVDWQISRRTSPVVDLVFLFVTGLQFKVFLDHQEELVNLYLETLKEALALVGCSCTYTRAQFDMDMEVYRHLYLNLLINTLPFSMLEEETFFRDVKFADRVPSQLVDLMINWLSYLDTKNYLI